MYETDLDTPSLGIIDYLKIIRERWLLGLATGILFSGLWCLYQLNQTPLYTSGLQVLIEIVNERVLDIQQVVDEREMTRSSAVLNQHLLQMQSGEFRQYVVEGLSASQVNAILSPYLSDELAAPSLSGVLAGSFDISVNDELMAYSISATHPTPEVAAMLANTYAEAYIRYLSGNVGSSNDNALSFLGLRGGDLEEQILNAEKELQAFKQKNNIVSIDASQNLILSQLQQYESERTRLTLELQELDTTVSQIGMAEGDLGKLLKIEAIAGYRNVSSYKQRIEMAKTEREQLAIELLERHPRMVQNESTITEFETLLADEVEEAIQNPSVLAEKIRAQYDLNTERITSTQEDLQRLEDLAIEYDVMVRAIESKKATLNGIRNRLNETEIASQLANANLRIIDSAYVPRVPSFPNVKKTAMVSGVLFFAFLCGLPIGLNFLNDKVKTPWDIEGFINKPLLGEILRFGKKDRENIDRVVSDGNDSGVSDTFRSIYNTIKLNDKFKSDKKIQVITSTIPAEGKTMFSMNYGFVVSQHGAKTLLVDCDLRKPRMEKYMNLTVDGGLVRWYDSGDAIPEGNLLGSSLGVLQLDQNTFILPAGKASSRSTEMVESNRFRDLLARLAEDYDYVIIDTPPVGVFPDALFLAEYADDVIYITSYNRVSKKTVKHFVSQLDKTKAEVCGLVMNGRKRSIGSGQSSYSYGYSSSYAEKYGQKYYAAKKG